jgi:ribosome maturation factor RimP
MKKLNTTLNDKLQNLLDSMGYEFVGGENVSQGQYSVLRVYIDSAKGVTIDDCTQVSRQLGAMLDVEGPMQGRYNLEVSSPGIDRPLFTLAHFEQQAGKTIKVKLSVPVNKRRQYKGLLAKVENGQIYLLEEGLPQAVQIPFSAIDKANVVGEIGFKRPK